MMYQKVNLERTAVYAGVPIGPGQNILVTEQQMEWLESQGHLDNVKQPSDTSVSDEEVEAAKLAGKLPGYNAVTGETPAAPAIAPAPASTEGPAATPAASPGGPSEGSITLPGNVHVENSGLSASTAQKLKDGGYPTVASVRKATDADLRTVKGIGAATITEIRGVIPAEGGTETA